MAQSNSPMKREIEEAQSHATATLRQTRKRPRIARGAIDCEMKDISLPQVTVSNPVLDSPEVRPRRTAYTRPTVADEEDEVVQHAPPASNNSLPTPAASFHQAEAQTSKTETQGPTPADRQIRRSMAPSVPEGGMHIVGSRVKILVDAINDLKKYGVDHIVTLPELVLVGDQSAGKSSLMGALAEIHLPRSSGCCTRSPAHIKTSPSPEWSCDISVQISHGYKPVPGKLIAMKDVTLRNPFYPWARQDLEVKHFKKITRKEDLEEVLRWAQIAILNPDKPLTDYIPGNINSCLDESTQAKFSPNVVSVEISGPELPALSFYDLPGIFQNAGHRDEQYLTKVVENLVTEYIKHPHALIIWALPMSADPATSRTGKVIADLNAENRCIGVLTKADQLQDGSNEDFTNVLRGESHRLLHGYFVTKQPVHSTNITDNFHAEARAAEEIYFDSNERWGGEWSEFRDRCGTSRLQQFLSQKFAQQIATSLPQIEYKIAQRTAETDNALAALPELPTENILHIVLQHLGEFSYGVKRLFEGGSSHNEFQSSWNTLCEQFGRTVSAMKPGMNLTHHSDARVHDFIVIDSDDENNMDVDAPNNTAVRPFNPVTPKGPQATHGQQTPNPFIKTNGTPGTPHQQAQIPLSAAQHQSRKLPADTDEESPFGQFRIHAGLGKGFATLDTIRATIHKHRRVGVQGIVNHETHEEMCLDSVQPWEKPLEMLMDLTMISIRNHAESILDKVLSKWSQTALYKQARDHLTIFMDHFESMQRESIDELIKLETYRMFTFNNVALQENIDREYKLLKAFRRDKRARAYISSQLAGGRKAPKHPKDVSDDILGEDPFKGEIEVAAYVRGYYVTAALRFVDNACMSMHGKLIKGVIDRIPHLLEQQLGLVSGNGELKCRELMEENDGTALIRRRLRTEKQNLQLFSARLVQLINDNAVLDAAVGQNGSGSNTPQQWAPGSAQQEEI